MSKQKESRPPMNPRVRSNLYGLGALYLVYLYYQIARPFLTRDPCGPTAGQFALGTLILGGGAVALGFLSWRMRKIPLPEEETDSIPEEAGEEETDRETEE